MPTKFEQFSNNAVTTLSAGITAGVTILTVTSSAAFPTDGNFHILIGNELLLVTAVSGTTFTVVRGVEVTVANAYLIGEQVALIVTQESLSRLMADYFPLHRDTDLPGPMNSIEDGVGGVLNAASFTWDNQGSSSVRDLTSNGIEWKWDLTTGDNIRFGYLSTPTAPFSTTACFFPGVTNHVSDGIGQTGLAFRESSSSKLYTFAVQGDKTLRVLKFTNSTTFSADLLAAINWNFNSPLWMKIGDDNTDLTFAISQDGVNFIEVASEARGTFFTTAPDQIGVFGNTNSASMQAASTLVYWRTKD